MAALNLLSSDEDRTVDLEPEFEAALKPATHTPPPAAYAPPPPPPRQAPAREAAPLQQPKDKLLRGRYEPIRIIGSGGTSIVYCARDLRRDEAGLQAAHIALKMLRPTLNKDPRSIARLEREFACTQALSHPNIVRVFDLDCHRDHTDPNGDQQWFITMELLEGELLTDLLKRTAPSPLPAATAALIMRACVAALTHAHDHGVVHGDFKPGNVFITKRGRVCLLDFGSSSGEGVDAIGPIGRSATPAYASPEVMSGLRPERRDDVFSFGCVAYQLLTGQHPFAQNSQHLENAQPQRSWSLTDRQWYALQSTLAPTRSERPDDLRRLLNDLLPLEPMHAIPAPDREEAPFKSRTATLLAPLMTIALILALGAGYFWFGPTLKSKIPQIVHAQRADAVAPAAEQSDSADVAQPPAAAPAAPAATTTTAEPPAETSPPAAAAKPAAPVVAPQDTPQPQAQIRRSPAQAQTTAVIPTRISFGASSIVVSEGATAAVLMLDRSENVTGRAQVRWEVLPGSAKSGVDYGALTTGIADFTDGQLRRAIYIPLVNDTLPEPDKTFAVQIADITGNVRVGPIARATVTIHDDD